MGLKLEAGKTYIDADGRKVRIICTDRTGMGAPCLGLVDLDGQEAINSYEKDGTGLDYCALVRECDPLGELPVDTPVWVRDFPEEEWKPRHYAGYKDKRGRYVAFEGGRTSHSNWDNSMWAWRRMTNVNPNDNA